MRMITLLTLCGIFASSALAGQETAGPPVAVLKYEWMHVKDLELELPVQDPTAPATPVAVWRDRDSPRGQARRAPGLLGLPKDVFDDIDQAHAPRPRKDTYRYAVTIRNLAERAIKAVVWEYIVVDLKSHAELARLKFTTAAKISPGKIKKLTASTWTPPTQTMSVQGLKHAKDPRAGESVEFREIRYADGSLWLRPR